MAGGGERIVFCELCVFDLALSVPFYSSKGIPRLQGVGIRISLDRVMVH